jgi:hypothetical protein
MIGIRTKYSSTLLITAGVIFSYTTASLHYSLAQIAHNVYHVIEHALHIEHHHELIPEEILHSHPIHHSHPHSHSHHHHTHHHLVDQLLESAKDDTGDEEEHTTNNSNIRLLDHLNSGILTFVQLHLPLQYLAFACRPVFDEWNIQPAIPPPEVVVLI